jgi:hypothetical protein
MPTKTRRNSRKGSYWMPEAEHAELRRYAARLDLSESQAVRKAVRLLLSDQHGRKDAPRVGP